MNSFDSELTSGCESGWTVYFEHSFCSYRDAKFVSETRNIKASNMQGEEEENGDDQSMISDASSGPPHFHEEGVNYCCDGDDDGNPLNDPPVAATFDKTSCRKRPELRFHIKQKESFLLDDTASSPLFTFKSNCLAKEKHPSTESSIDSSLGFSATHFQGRSSFQEPFGFLRSPQSGNKF